MGRRLDAAAAPDDEPAPATDEPAGDAATATLVARAANEYLERLAAAGSSPRTAAASPLESCSKCRSARISRSIGSRLLSASWSWI